MHVHLLIVPAESQVQKPILNHSMWLTGAALAGKLATHVRPGRDSSWPWYCTFNFLCAV